MEVVDEEGLILSISENGYGKRTRLTDYRITSRGGKGVINMKTTSPQRQGGGDPVGEGRHGPDDHHQGRQDHPAGGCRNPAGRPLDPGGAAGALEEGDQVAAASVIPEAAENGENGLKPDGQGDLPLQ